MMHRILYILRAWRARSRLLPDGLPGRATDIILSDGPAWARVTRRRYPQVHAALETISHDSGSGAGRNAYRVPPHWAGWLPLFERWLSAMPDEERRTFVLPVNDQTGRICAAHHGASALNAFLGDFFEGFLISADDVWPTRLMFNSEPGDGQGTDDAEFPDLVLRPCKPESAP